jgi:trimethylamine--corrinoid protein Co-methyltransferase
MAVDLIKQVGPGGSYIVAKHTINRMKTEAVMTKLADRDARSIWEKKGATDIQTRALKKVKDIMKSNTQPLISDEIEAKLRAEFPGMVAGELLPIE